MQALINIAATASLALAIGGGVAVKHASFDVDGSADTPVAMESQVELAHQTSASLDEAASVGATIDGIGSQPGDPELAAGIGSAAHIGAAGAAALDPGGAQVLSVAANTDESGTKTAAALVGATSARLDVDGSATINLDTQLHVIDDAGISGGSKVGGTVELALRAR